MFDFTGWAIIWIAKMRKRQSLVKRIAEYTDEDFRFGGLL